MANIEARLDRIEKELQFRTWIYEERLLESLSVEELEHMNATGEWPQKPPPAPGESRLDTMDRRSLIELWKSHSLQFEGRNSDQVDFWVRHGHWTEQACRAGCSGRLCDTQSAPR